MTETKAATPAISNANAVANIWAILLLTIPAIFIIVSLISFISGGLIKQDLEIEMMERCLEQAPAVDCLSAYWERQK